MSEILYLYGFVPPDAQLPAAGLAGIEDRAVELLPQDDIAAAVSRVPADEFSATQVESRLEDLRWLAHVGVQHERVVAWFVDHAQILPVRMLTLYSGDAPLAEEIRVRLDTIRAQMARFAGLREWDLKVSYDARKLAERLGDVSAEIAALDAEIEAATPGRRFLLQKKRADLAAVEVARSARRLADELYGSVAAFARESVLVPIPREAAELPVVLNAAFLMESRSEAAAREAAGQKIAELAEHGVHATFSGPWAPYRFMTGSDGDREERS